MDTQTQPNSDERILAALAHGSVFLSFLGPIGPLIVWITQRRKSKYASFHAMQAMGFQVITFWLWIFLSALLPFLFLILFFIGIFAFGNSDNFEIFPIVFQVLFFIGIFGIWGIYLLVGLVGAGFSIAGKNFRYPLLGNWLEKYLETSDEAKEIFNQEHEDSWIAAICHATTAIFLWGITVPVIAWFSQKSRSLRLGFQAAQATIYQLIAIITYFVGTAFYMLLFFGFMAALILGSVNAPNAQAEMPAWVGVISLAFMVLIGLFWLVAMIATPIYFIISGIAFFRTLRGRDFHYPFIGRFVARWMKSGSQLTKENLEG